MLCRIFQSFFLLLLIFNLIRLTLDRLLTSLLEGLLLLVGANTLRSASAALGSRNSPSWRGSSTLNLFVIIDVGLRIFYDFMINLLLINCAMAEDCKLFDFFLFCCAYLIINTAFPLLIR